MSSIKVELINSLITTAYIRTKVSLALSVPGTTHPLLFLSSMKRVMPKEKESVVLLTFPSKELTVGQRRFQLLNAFLKLEKNQDNKKQKQINNSSTFYDTNFTTLSSNTEKD